MTAALTRSSTRWLQNQ